MVIELLNHEVDMRDFLLNRGWSYFETNFFQDVLKAIVQFSVLLLAINLFFFYFHDVSKREWNVMSAWVKKDFYCEFLHIGWEKVTYPGEYFERHVTKEIIVKDQYVLEVVAKFKSIFHKAITLAVISILITTLNILWCFSEAFIENRRLHDQIQTLKKQFIEKEKELKHTIDQLKVELSTRPKIQPTPPISPIRSRDLGDGRGSV